MPERLQDIYGRKEGKRREMGKKIMEGRGKGRKGEWSEDKIERKLRRKIKDHSKKPTETAFIA